MSAETTLNQRSSVEAQVVDGFAAIETFHADWERVFRSSPNEPSTSVEWTQALARHYLEPGDRCFVVRLGRGGVAVGFVPLIARTVHVFRQPYVLLLPLAEIFNTHSDLLLADRSRDIVDGFLSALRTLDIRWDCLRLSKLLEQNPITSLLAECATARGWKPQTRLWRAAYHLEFPASFNAYLGERSGKFRNHAKRAEKKLRARGELRVVEITNKSELECGYDALLQVERASWKESHGVSINAVAQQTAFYREWCHAAALAGRLHLQLLTLNGEAIAHNVGYVNDGCYYYLKTTYSAEHRAASPATFLRLRLIESLIARGVRSIDFPGIPFEWEHQWTSTSRWQNVVSIYPDTLRGKILARLDRWTHHSSPTREVRHGDIRPDAIGDQ